MKVTCEKADVRRKRSARAIDVQINWRLARCFTSPDEACLAPLTEVRLQRVALVAAFATQVPDGGTVEDRLEQQRHRVLSHRESNAVPAEPLAFSRVDAPHTAVCRFLVDAISKGDRLHSDAVDDPNGHQVGAVDDVV